MNIQRSPFGQWLDLFRWTAAFVVLYAHAINIYMIPASSVKGEKSLTHLIVAFPTGFAQQAVMVFFVMSGLLVGGELLKQWQSGGAIEARNYVIKRLSRLWTVLLPIFAFTYFCNWIGLEYFHADSYYRSDTRETMSIQALSCNVAFMHLALCRPFGNNGPLWSLFNEFWYYMAWLGVVWGLTRAATLERIVWLTLTAAGLAVLTSIQFAGAPLAPYMLIWLIGVFVLWSPKPLVKSVLVAACVLIVALLAVRIGVRRDFWEANPVWTFVLDFAVAALFGNLLLTMREAKELPSPPMGRLFSKLAEFSFTLYCIHEPILVLWAAIFKVEKILPNSFGNVISIIAPMLVIVAIAWVFSLFTERQTPRVRRFAQKMFGIEGRARIGPVPG